MDGWMLKGTKKDEQSITADWTLKNLKNIDGVKLHEVKNVPKEDGYLTELYRSDWQLEDLGVDQVFQVRLNPGGLSAWHVHKETTDRLFVNFGIIKVVLYDARDDSPTKGLINEFRLSTVRPGLLIVPPKVWHGIKNIGNDPALIVNLVDKGYRYIDPDHYRLPEDTDQIPYRF